MCKSSVLVAALCLIGVAQAGLIPAHTAHVVHEPVIAKVGEIVHTAPSAVSHQSITQVHGGKTIVQPVLAPVVKTTTLHHAVPVVKTVVSAPVVHTYAAQPVVHHAVPLVHAGPVLKTYVASPISHAVHY